MTQPTNDQTNHVTEMALSPESLEIAQKLYNHCLWEHRGIATSDVLGSLQRKYKEHWPDDIREVARIEEWLRLRSNEHIVDDAVKLLQKGEYREAHVSCFNEDEAGQLKRYIARTYPDLVASFTVSWIVFRGAQ